MNAFRYVALVLIVLGAALIFGLITLFPSTTSCVGLFLFGQCVGYYSTSFNGNNFILGLAFAGIGGLLFVTKGKKR